MGAGPISCWASEVAPQGNRSTFVLVEPATKTCLQGHWRLRKGTKLAKVILNASPLSQTMLILLWNHRTQVLGGHNNLHLNDVHQCVPNDQPTPSIRLSPPKKRKKKPSNVSSIPLPFQNSNRFRNIPKHMEDSKCFSLLGTQDLTCPLRAPFEARAAGTLSFPDLASRGWRGWPVGPVAM